MGQLIEHITLDLVATMVTSILIVMIVGLIALLVRGATGLKPVAHTVINIGTAVLSLSVLVLLFGMPVVIQVNQGTLWWLWAGNLAVSILAISALAAIKRAV